MKFIHAFMNWYHVAFFLVGGLIEYKFEYLSVKTIFER